MHRRQKKRKRENKDEKRLDANEMIPTQFCSFEKNQKLSETDVCYGGVNEAFIFPFTWGLTSGLENSSWP